MSDQADRLCLVEDDPIMGESLCQRFMLEGIAHDWFQTGGEALDALRVENYAAIVSDIRLPDISGEQLFNEILAERPVVPPTLLITGFGSIDQAVRMLKLGVRDYITKPFDLDSLLDKLRILAPSLFELREADCLLGISQAMRGIEAQLKRMAAFDSSVLITGESGVGKEYAAQYFHSQIDTSGCRPLIALNCASVAENLIESELFGHEKGAFTGAIREHRGVFERADGGTLLLDEIGDMPLHVQAKLLRVVQEQQVIRVGSEKAIPVRFRLICATNTDLKQAILNGEFREDLFYRISGVHLHIPPLRERPDDILHFAHLFVAAYNRRYETKKFLASACEHYLRGGEWPGNLRELKHAVEQACIFSPEEMITTKDFIRGNHSGGGEPNHPGEQNLHDYVLSKERERILEYLEQHHWKIQETAAALNISRKSLWEKMRKHQIEENSQGN